MRALTTLLLLTGCSSVPDAPPASYATAEGTTHAHDAATAERHGRQATELSIRVGDLLGLETRAPFQLRILDRETEGSGGASTVRWYDADGLIERYIQLGSEGRAESLRLLAHELVHWHVEETWELPLVVEEGLAERISASLVPRGEELLAQRRRDALEALARDEPILRAGRPLRIDRAGWQRLSPREKNLLYAYGTLHVEGLEIAELRDLDHEHRAEALRADSSPSVARSSTR
jgi:hypothetical protein